MNGDSILEVIGTAEDIKSKYYGFINHLGITVYNALNFLGIGEGFSTNLKHLYSVSNYETEVYKVSPDLLVKIPYSSNIYYRYTIPIVNQDYSKGPASLSTVIINELNTKNSQLVKLTEKLLGGVKISKNNRKMSVPYIPANISFRAEHSVIINGTAYKTNTFEATSTLLSYGESGRGDSHILTAEDNRLAERLTTSPLYDYVLKHKIITN